MKKFNDFFISITSILNIIVVFSLIGLCSFTLTNDDIFFKENLAYGHANAPVISSAETTATNEITVTFSNAHNIDQSSVSGSDFSISGDGVSGLSISSATGTGNREVTITLSGDVSAGTITLEVVGEIQNSHGNSSLTSGTTNVSNNHGGDITAPTMDSAITVTTTRIDVTFSEDLDASTIAASDFGIQGSNGVSAAAENSAGVVTLTLNSAIDTGDTPVVTRGTGNCASNSISDLAGNTMCPTTLTATDGLSPTFTAERTAIDTLIITFSEDVDADSANENSAWTVSGGTVTATSDPATSDSMTITFSGITDTTSTPTVTYVAANGTVDDVANNEISNGVNAVATDGVSPTVTITSVSGSDGSKVNLSILTYTVTFSESVSDFVIGDITKTGNSISTISNFAGSGTTYTFNVDVESDGTVVVQVEQNKARDSSSNQNTASNIYNLTSSSSSSSSSTSSGGGKNNCDSNRFGKNQSLKVYEISYDVDTYKVQVQAYSTCGTISTKMTTPSGQSILGLSLDQPYIDDGITVYSGFLDESDEKFNISVQNKRNSFTETFYTYDKSITKKYTRETGYTSEQQGTALPVLTSEQITVVSEPSVTQIVQTIKESVSIDTKQILDKKSDNVKVQPIEYIPEPIAEKEIKSQCGVGTKVVDGICKIIKTYEPQFCFLFWCW